MWLPLEVSEIFYLLRPILFITLIIISFGKNFKKTSGYILNKSCTEELKGIAIMLVIFGHLSADKIIHAPYLAYAGSQGVTLFLFISGYGLTKSYIKNGISKEILIRRFKRILIPYSIITALWIIIDMFIYHKTYSLHTIFLALAGMDFSRSIDASMWYISFILLWYLFFNITFKLPVKNVFKLMILLFISYLFKYHPLTRYTHEVSYQWGLSAFTFPIGVLAGLYIDRINKKLSEKHRNLIYFSTAMVSFIIYIVSLKYINISTSIFTISNFSFAFMVIIIIMFLNREKYYSRLLGFIGFISYELYLLEGALMWKYMWIRQLQPYSAGLFLAVYFCSVVILSYGLDKFMAVIVNFKINNFSGKESVSFHSL